MKRRRRRSFLFRNWQWIAVSAITLASVCLGFSGFEKYGLANGAPYSALTSLYLSLQLFTLNSGGVGGRLPWELEAARFMAPLVPGWAIVAAALLIFHHRIQSLHLRFARNHTVVCGLGRKGTQLADDFMNKGQRVVLVDRDASAARVEEARRQGLAILVGDCADPAILKRARVHRAANLVATCHDDDANVETVLRAGELLANESPGRRGGETAPLRCFVHIFDPLTCDLFRLHDILAGADASMETHLFNVYAMTARALFGEHPLDWRALDPGDSRTPHLIVVGLGLMGESLALQAARIAHYANHRRLRLSVIDREAAARCASFRRRYPNIDRVCDFRDAIQGEIAEEQTLSQLRALLSDAGSLPTLAVCLDDDWRSVEAAVGAMRRLPDPRIPVLVRLTGESVLKSLLNAGALPGNAEPNVAPFGAIRDVCALDRLLSGEIDRLARAFHEHYRTRRSSGSAGSNGDNSEKANEEEGKGAQDPAMADWERLSPVLRESNRLQADHLPVKLRAVGRETAALSDPRPCAEPFSDGEIEIMARMEHDRWKAERFLLGWSHGPRNLAAKTSPRLVEWNELEESVRSYNRESVRAIPEILQSLGQKTVRRKISAAD